MSKSDIRLIQMNSYETPKIEEKAGKQWVLYGQNNSFYKYLIDRKEGSPTNSAIINTYCSLIYGRGLTNLNSNVQDFLKFKKMLSKDDLKRIIQDFALFTEASILISKKRGAGTLPIIRHLPKENTAPEKVNDKNVIEAYYYSENFKKANYNKDAYERYEVINDKNAKTKKNLTYPIRPYSSGMKYFNNPDYLSGIPYATMEEEIGRYYVSHIQNGLSFGYIIDIPDGDSYSPEEKEELERQIKKKLTGSQNAGRFVLNFKGSDTAITIIPLEGNVSHKQWEYLTNEARQQLMTAHRVTSPMLFGIKDSTGLGNNADEMDVAESQLIKRVVAPKQEYILDALENIASFYGLSLDLSFLPLTEVKVSDDNAKEQGNIKVEMSDNEKLEQFLGSNVDSFIEMGEVIDSNIYEEIENRDNYKGSLTDSLLNGVLTLASAPKSTPSKKSEQDTSLFKVRYEYAGNPKTEREFCRKVMQAGRSYRVEDLHAASQKVVNAGFGPKGTNTYDIFLYKGGVNCKHFWQRKIYLRKNNKRISVNEARRMILELDPDKRKDARLEKNPKEVAQIAGPSNNFWRLK